MARVDSGPRTGCSRNQRHQSGFSLIEVLVAFMILAMALTVIFRIFAGGLRNVSLSEDYARAELVAQSQMNMSGLDEPLREGSSSGEWGERFTWQRTIERYQPWSDQRKLNASVDAFEITVRVSWRHSGGDSEIILSSVRLQPIDPLKRRI